MSDPRRKKKPGERDVEVKGGEYSKSNAVDKSSKMNAGAVSGFGELVVSYFPMTLFTFNRIYGSDIGSKNQTGFKSTIQ